MSSASRELFPVFTQAIPTPGSGLGLAEAPAKPQNERTLAAASLERLLEVIREPKRGMRSGEAIKAIFATLPPKTLRRALEGLAFHATPSSCLCGQCKVQPESMFVWRKAPSVRIRAVVMGRALLR